MFKNKKLILGIIMMILVVTIAGCVGDKDSGKSNTNIDVSKVTAADFINMLDDESEIFTLTNKELIDIMDKAIEKEEDGFPLIDQMLYNIDLRGYKYEEILATMQESITVDEEAIRENNVDKITDRVLKELVKEIHNDGYELVFRDQYIMLSYDIPKFLEKYKSQLPAEYVEAKLKLNKYINTSVRTELPKSEDSEDDTPEYKLEFEEAAKIIVDLDKTIIKTKYEPIQEEIEELILYYISLISGLVDQNLVLKDAETIDPGMLKAFEYITKNAESEALVKLSIAIEDAIKEDSTMSKAFLDKTVMSLYSYIDENKSNIYSLDEYNELVPEDEKVEIEESLEPGVKDVIDKEVNKDDPIEEKSDVEKPGTKVEEKPEEVKPDKEEKIKK